MDLTHYLVVHIDVGKHAGNPFVDAVTEEQYDELIASGETVEICWSGIADSEETALDAYSDKERDHTAAVLRSRGMNTDHLYPEEA